MIDFSVVTAQGYNIDNLIATVNQPLLFSFEFNQQISLKKLYYNPLRHDKKPGCRFYWKGSILFFIDFAKNKNYTIISFVKEKYNFTFQEALDYIANQTISRDYKPDLVIESCKKEEDKTNFIQFKPRDFTVLDIQYWLDYGIDVNSQEFIQENVFSIEKLYLNEKKLPVDKLAFAYYYPDIDKTKIYQPYSNYKWLSTVPFDYIENLLQVVEEKYSYKAHKSFVIVAKSKKDRLVLQPIINSLNQEYGIYIVLVNSQSEKPSVISQTTQEVLSIFDYKYCFFDNDVTGKESNKILNEQGYSWINIDNYLYDIYMIKDPSDYIKFFKETSYLRNLIIRKLKLNE